MKKKIKNLLAKIFTFVLLIATVLCTSGCFSDPGKYGSSFIGSIQGFKANYRSDSYDYVDFYYDFAKTTLAELYQTFYFNSNNDFLTSTGGQQTYVEMAFKQKYELDADFVVDKTSDLWKQFVVYYFSDIKYSTKILTNSNGSPIDPTQNIISSDFYYTKSSVSWNWSFATGLHALENEEKQANSILDFYKNGNFVLQSSTLDSYAKGLQVATLQIVLGQTPTIFDSQTISNANDILGTASIQNGKVQATGLLNQLVTKGSYVGINQQALLQIKQYILNNIIGEQKFSENNTSSNFSKDDYGFILDKIWEQKQYFGLKNTLDETDKTDYGCVFDVYPATKLKDFSSNSFFISSEDDNAFANIPKAEYQSIVIMPSKQQYLEEIWFYLASDREMTVRYYTRTFDSKSGTVSVGPTKQVKTNIESDFVFEDARHGTVLFYKNNSETIVKTQVFNNNIGDGIINTNGQEKQMTYQMSQYFEAVDSQNGFGTVSVLNYQKFAQAEGCSYIEIVFDVVKDADQNQDYSFKVGISYYGIPSSSEIADFLLENQ